MLFRSLGIGVTIFNRMTGLDIDPDAEAPIMHGGPWAIQYPLRWISEISQKVDIDIAGSGGVASGVDAAKYILAGATVVQMCTAIVLNGYGAIGEVIGGLARWMDDKGHPDLASFRGVAARRILGTHEVDRAQKFTALIHPHLDAPCVHACPAHVPAQTYVDRIARGDFAGALEAVREAQRCLRCGCGIGCELCLRICPYDAVKADGYYFSVDTELCKGCGLCIERCPLSNISAQSSVVS